MKFLDKSVLRRMASALFLPEIVLYCKGVRNFLLAKSGGTGYLYAMEQKMNRREWIRRSAAGAAGLFALGALESCDGGRLERIAPGVRIPERLPDVPSFPVARLGDRLPKLSVATAAFPKSGKTIDRTEGMRIVRAAADHGVRLFDTAWPQGEGDGEKLIGESLSGRSRDAYRLSTSMPTWDIRTLSDAESVFARQLDYFRTDCIDFYALQAVNSWAKYEAVYLKTGILEFLKRKKAEGRIRHLGIDMLGDRELLGQLTGSEAWDFMKVPCNSFDDRRTGGSQQALVAQLAEIGIPSFVTNPTKEGSLRLLSGDATDILYGEFPELPAAGWALREAAGLDGCGTVVDSVPDFRALQEDLLVFGSGPLQFSPQEEAVWTAALNAYLANREIRCTACGNCQPCPYGIAIPKIFGVYNEILKEDMLPNRFGDVYSEAFERKGICFLNRYRKAVRAEESALRCIGCNRCMAKCPQRIAIPSQLEHIAAIVEAVRDAAVGKICGF